MKYNKAKKEYIANPCAASSLPFWKTAGISIPDNMLVVRDDMLSPEMLHGYKDEPYFKLCHVLNHVESKLIPAGFNLIPATISDFSRHIEECYAQEMAATEELSAYQKRPTYCPDLWIALADNATGRIAASGIAEYDAEIEEGILEWIQVTPAYRRRGLGEYVVNELLSRLKPMAKFVTVSGRVHNDTKPELLYKKCGFDNMVIWHVLTREPFADLDNHDRRIRYFELMLERDLDDLPQYELPAGYHFEFYHPGDRDNWIAIEQSAKEILSYEKGIKVWDDYYGTHEQELPDRMVFVVNEGGEKIATATAYYDVMGNDNSGDGWLHWVAVKREYQGKGISKPLIAFTLNRLLELGYTHAKIPTQTYTWLACKIYLDFGFRPIPENAVESRDGWRIIKRLTNHPALDLFDIAADDEIWKEESR